MLDSTRPRRSEALQAMPKRNSIEIRFPSEVEHVDLVHSICDSISAHIGLDENQALNLGLAVREATINAIKHGHHFDAKKKVCVQFHYGREGVLVSITDQGEGFDPDSMPDPTLPENIHRSSGRGFLMMRAFVDSVEVVPGRTRGSVVRLFKKAPGGARAAKRHETAPAVRG